MYNEQSSINFPTDYSYIINIISETIKDLKSTHIELVGVEIYIVDKYLPIYEELSNLNPIVEDVWFHSRSCIIGYDEDGDEIFDFQLNI